MIARLLICKDLPKRIGEIGKILSQAGLKRNHPDVLYLDSTQKLGIEQARKIKEHFSLKPYQAMGRAVVLEDASVMTVEAQNALLKTLEELPKDAVFILGVDSDSKLLPTVLSRCQIIPLPKCQANPTSGVGFEEDLERLLTSDALTRFEYIEKLKDKEEFLKFMVHYFDQNLRSHPKGANLAFLKVLLQAEEWAQHNVNIRAILEYLMLSMPQKV